MHKVANIWCMVIFTTIQIFPTIKTIEEFRCKSL